MGTCFRETLPKPRRWLVPPYTYRVATRGRESTVHACFQQLHHSAAVALSLQENRKRRTSSPDRRSRAIGSRTPAAGRSSIKSSVIINIETGIRQTCRRVVQQFSGAERSDESQRQRCVHVDPHRPADCREVEPDFSGKRQGDSPAKRLAGPDLKCRSECEQNANGRENDENHHDLTRLSIPPRCENSRRCAPEPRVTSPGKAFANQPGTVCSEDGGAPAHSARSESEERLERQRGQRQLAARVRVSSVMRPQTPHSAE